MSSSIIAAAIRRAEPRIIGRLTEAGATGADAPHPLDGLRGMEVRQLGRLKKARAVREAGAGFYYFDEPAYAAYSTRRRATVAILIVGVFGVTA